MLKDKASGAVKILRQTSSTGTGSPPPCELYSARHNNTFIVTQNTAMKINNMRELICNQSGGRLMTWPTRSFFGFNP